jgi:2-amino-4-hydroxy-6-hydroxymethyldihydropteridine diphosphokinase
MCHAPGTSPLLRQAFIGLGSNLGDRLQWLQRALTNLHETAGIRVGQVSSVYETEPVGPVAQGWFLNAVVELHTSLEPMTLLTRTQEIEHALERVRVSRWGPRTVDLDILLYDGIEMRSAALEIPHPELCHRAFVMIPLLELVPDITLPDGTRVRCCLNRLKPPQIVRCVASAALRLP